MRFKCGGSAAVLFIVALLSSFSLLVSPLPFSETSEASSPERGNTRQFFHTSKTSQFSAGGLAEDRFEVHGASTRSADHTTINSRREDDLDTPPGIDCASNADEGDTPSDCNNSTQLPPPPPPPPPKPFVYGAVALKGPSYENLTSSEAREAFVMAVQGTLTFLGRTNLPEIEVYGWCRVKGDGCKYADQVSEATITGTRSGTRPRPHAGSSTSAAAAGSGAGAGDGAHASPHTDSTLAGSNSSALNVRNSRSWEGLGQGEGEDGSRRARVVVDGAIVHFRAVGYLSVYPPDEYQERVRKDLANVINTTAFLSGVRSRMTARGFRVIEAGWKEYPLYCEEEDATATCNMTLIRSSIEDAFYIDFTLDFSAFPTFDVLKDSFLILVLLAGITAASLILWGTIKCQQLSMSMKRHKGASESGAPKKRKGGKDAEKPNYHAELKDSDGED